MAIVKVFSRMPKLYIISRILLLNITYHFVQSISYQTHTTRGWWCNCVQFHGLVLRFKTLIAALWTTRSLLNAKRDLGCTTVRLHILLSGPHLLIVQIKYQFGENAVLSHVFLNVTCVWTKFLMFADKREVLVGTTRAPRPKAQAQCYEPVHYNRLRCSLGRFFSAKVRSDFRLLK